MIPMGHIESSHPSEIEVIAIGAPLKAMDFVPVRTADLNKNTAAAQAKLSGRAASAQNIQADKSTEIVSILDPQKQTLGFTTWTPPAKKNQGRS